MYLPEPSITGEPFLILQLTPYLKERIIAFAVAISTLVLYYLSFENNSDYMTSDNLLGFDLVQFLF